jgi:hypothetical protein
MQPMNPMIKLAAPTPTTILAHHQPTALPLPGGPWRNTPTTHPPMAANTPIASERNLGVSIPKKLKLLAANVTHDKTQECAHNWIRQKPPGRCFKHRIDAQHAWYCPFHYQYYSPKKPRSRHCFCKDRFPAVPFVVDPLHQQGARRQCIWNLFAVFHRVSTVLTSSSNCPRNWLNLPLSCGQGHADFPSRCTRCLVLSRGDYSLTLGPEWARLPA